MSPMAKRLMVWSGISPRYWAYLKCTSFPRSITKGSDRAAIHDARRRAVCAGQRPDSPDQGESRRGGGGGHGAREGGILQRAGSMERAVPRDRAYVLQG